MKSFTNAAAGFMLGLGLMGLAGCATTGYSEIKSIDIKTRKDAYEREFKDSYLGNRIISKDNDLYVGDLEGKNIKRITQTPAVKETFAFFTKDAKYVFYMTTDDNFMTERYYLVPLDSTNNAGREIGSEEYTVYHKERINE